MVSINWTIHALNDLEEIKDYISHDSKRYAEIVVKKLFLSTRILKTNPKIGRIVPEINDVEIREIVHTNYRIIYRIVSSKRIDIITVHHTSRLFFNNPSIADII